MRLALATLALLLVGGRPAPSPALPGTLDGWPVRNNWIHLAADAPTERGARCTIINVGSKPAVVQVAGGIPLCVFMLAEPEGWRRGGPCFDGGSSTPREIAPGDTVRFNLPNRLGPTMTFRLAIFYQPVGEHRCEVAVAERELVMAPCKTIRFHPQGTDPR